MDDDLIDWLDACARMYPAIGAPKNGKMFAEAAARIRTLAAERDRLREAFRAEREENLWNAFNIGSIRSDGKWIDCGLSDAEWLVRELGLDEDAYGHDPEEIKRRIPGAAMRAAARS